MEEQLRLSKIIKDSYALLQNPMARFVVVNDKSPTLNQDVIDIYNLTKCSSMGVTGAGARVEHAGLTRFATNIRESAFQVLNRAGESCWRIETCPDAKKSPVHLCSADCYSLQCEPSDFTHSKLVRQTLTSDIQRSTTRDMRTAICCVLVDPKKNAVIAIENVYCLPKADLFDLNGCINLAKKSNADYKACRYGMYGSC